MVSIGIDPYPSCGLKPKMYIYIYIHTIYYTLLHHIWPYIHQRVTPHEIPMAVVAPSLRRSTLGISTGEVLWVGRARKDTWRWVGWAEEWLGEMYIYCIYIYINICINIYIYVYVLIYIYIFENIYAYNMQTIIASMVSLWYIYIYRIIRRYMYIYTHSAYR